MAALRKAATIQKATGEDDWRDDGIATIEESEKVRRRTSESHENEHTTGQGRERAQELLKQRCRGSRSGGCDYWRGAL